MSSYYVRLPSDQWASRSVGYLVVEIIAGLVLITSLFFVRSFKWVSGGTTDAVRTYVFIFSTVATVIYFILDLSNVGNDEKGLIVNLTYYVLYIFLELFYLIAEFTILFVAMRTVNLAAFADLGISSASRPVRLLTIGLLGIVGGVSLTTFCLYTAFYGSYAHDDFNANKLLTTIIGFFVTYSTVYLVASIYILGVAVFAAVRTRSKASIIMVLVAICLTIRTVVYLADIIVDYFPSDTVNRVNLDWANSFIYNIMIIAIYAGITAVAVIGSGFNQMQKQDRGSELAPFATPHVYE